MWTFQFCGMADFCSENTQPSLTRAVTNATVSRLPALGATARLLTQSLSTMPPPPPLANLLAAATSAEAEREALVPAVVQSTSTRRSPLVSSAREGG